MNTDLMREKLKKLDDLRLSLEKENSILASLELRNGQSFGSINVFGKSFNLVSMNSRSYGPEACESLNVVRHGLIDIQKMTISGIKSTIEGVEFSIKQMAYEATK